MDPCTQAKAARELARAHAAELYHGLSPSRLRGRGLEYVDFRDYHPGDDVRRIDWKLTARQPQTPGAHPWLMVREYEEEHSLPLTLALSLSPTMYYKNKPPTLSYTATLTALLSHRLGDHLTLALLGNGVKLKPLTNPTTAPNHITREICKGPQAPLEDEPLALAQRTRRGIIVFITDYDMNPTILKQAARLLKTRKTRLLTIIIYEKTETTPPANGKATLQHPSGTARHTTLAQAYKQIRQHTQRVKTSLKPYPTLTLEATHLHQNHKNTIITALLKTRARTP